MASPADGNGDSTEPARKPLLVEKDMTFPTWSDLQAYLFQVGLDENYPHNRQWTVSYSQSVAAYNRMVTKRESKRISSRGKYQNVMCTTRVAAATNGFVGSAIYERVYCCTEGRRTRERGTGVRDTQRTGNLGCQDSFTARVDLNQGCVVIVSRRDGHNHAPVRMASELSTTYRTRTIAKSPAVREKIILLADAGGKTPRIKDQIQQAHPQVKSITSKNIYNITQAERSRRDQLLQEDNVVPSAASMFRELVRRMQAMNENVYVQFDHNEDTQEVVAVHCMLPGQKELACNYQEVLLIDSTYSTNKRGWYYVILAVEDPFGNTTPVAQSFLSRQTSSMFLQSFAFFKSCVGVSWNPTVTIVTDKDMAETKAAQEMWPNSEHLLCTWHVKKAIRQRAMALFGDINVTHPGVKQQLVDLATSLADAYSPTAFEDLYHGLLSRIQQATAAPPNLHPFVEYLEVNWLPIKSQWVRCFREQNVTFGNRTTNRVESENRTLKHIIGLNDQMEMHHVLELTRIYVCGKMEEFLAEARRNLNTRATLYRDGISRELYEVLEECYAVLPVARGGYSVEQELLEATIRREKNGYVCLPQEDHGIYQVGRSQNAMHKVSVTELDCDCEIRVALLFPCRHILIAVTAEGNGVRALSGVIKEASSTFARRWTRSLLSRACQEVTEAYYPVKRGNSRLKRVYDRVVVEPDSDLESLSSSEIVESHSLSLTEPERSPKSQVPQRQESKQRKRMTEEDCYFAIMRTSKALAETTSRLGPKKTRMVLLHLRELRNTILRGDDVLDATTRMKDDSASKRLKTTTTDKSIEFSNQSPVVRGKPFQKVSRDFQSGRSEGRQSRTELRRASSLRREKSINEPIRMLRVILVELTSEKAQSITGLPQKLESRMPLRATQFFSKLELRFDASIDKTMMVELTWENCIDLPSLPTIADLVRVLTQFEAKRETLTKEGMETSFVFKNLRFTFELAGRPRWTTYDNTFMLLSALELSDRTALFCTRVLSMLDNQDFHSATRVLFDGRPIADLLNELRTKMALLSLRQVNITQDEAQFTRQKRCLLGWSTDMQALLQFLNCSAVPDGMENIKRHVGDTAVVGFGDLASLVPSECLTDEVFNFCCEYLNAMHGRKDRQTAPLLCLPLVWGTLLCSETTQIPFAVNNDLDESWILAALATALYYQYGRINFEDAKVNFTFTEGSLVYCLEVCFGTGQATVTHLAAPLQPWDTQRTGFVVRRLTALQAYLQLDHNCPGFNTIAVSIVGGSSRAHQNNSGMAQLARMEYELRHPSGTLTPNETEILHMRLLWLLRLTPSVELEESSTETRKPDDSQECRVSSDDLSLLNPGAWFNDTIINAYLGLLEDRQERNGVEADKFLVLNTFFTVMMEHHGLESVLNWTKPLRAFDSSISRIVIPVHMEAHWAVVFIDKKRKSIEWIDSKLGYCTDGAHRHLDMIGKWLHAQGQRQYGTNYRRTVWTKTIRKKGVPQQRNNNDCGPFVCKFSECLAVGRPLDFSQRDMPSARRNIREALVNNFLL